MDHASEFFQEELTKMKTELEKDNGDDWIRTESLKECIAQLEEAIDLSNV